MRRKREGGERTVTTVAVGTVVSITLSIDATATLSSTEASSASARADLFGSCRRLSWRVCTDGSMPVASCIYSPRFAKVGVGQCMDVCTCMCVYAPAL